MLLEEAFTGGGELFWQLFLLHNWLYSYATSSQWPRLASSLGLISHLRYPYCILNMIIIEGHLFSSLPNQWQHQDWAERPIVFHYLHKLYQKLLQINRNYKWTQYSCRAIGISKQDPLVTPSNWTAIPNSYHSFCYPLLCFLMGFYDTWDSLRFTL